MSIALALVLALTGCQATQRQNATTGEYETNSTTQGALIGAIAGAAIGLATGDNAKERRKHALTVRRQAVLLEQASVITLTNKKQNCVVRC